MTVFLMALLSTAAIAADRPGQKFLLKPSDLPKPYATPAVANNNTLVPRPAGVMPQVHGFRFCRGFNFSPLPGGGAQWRCVPVRAYG
jgi:hypothetical protein